MPTSVTELADRFGYPDALTQILKTIAETVTRSAPARFALVLSGSVATGDFVWRSGAGGVRLLSDIDATLFVDGDWTGQSELDAMITRIETEIGSPLFHIDLSTLPFRSLTRIANRFQHVEARLAGIVLAGEDVLSHYPQSVDARAARQSTLGNLWKCVLNWSPEKVDGEDEAYRIALSRTILDLPILALSERSECIAGHRNRCEAFLAQDDAPPLVDSTTRSAVRLGLRMREEGAASREELETAALASVCAAMMLFGVPEQEVFSASSEVVRKIAALFPSRDFRRFLGESRGLRSEQGGALASLRWWLRRKEPVGAAALLGLFAYTVSGGVDDPSQAIALRLSEYGGRAPVSGRGSEYVFAARQEYWRGRCRLNPSDAAKSEFYRKLLGDEVGPRSAPTRTS